MPGTRRPPSHTALAALPAIALDLETTGLDVAEGRIVQIGAVAIDWAGAPGESRERVARGLVILLYRSRSRRGAVGG